MRAWALITLAGSMMGCVVPHEAYVADTDPVSWRASVAVAVTVPNTDTLTPRDLSIVIRSSGRCCEDTLTLHIAALAPGSIRYEEPFTLSIPRSSSAAAISSETEIPYRRNAVLSDTGDYLFTFAPTRTVRGIEAVGLKITVHND